MLPTESRLRRREDFAAAVRRGRRAGRPLLVVHFRSGSTDPHPPGGSLPPVRAGFVVSKAVGGAVVRNLVKRRLRHLMRDRLSLLPAGSLVVVRALPGAGEAEHAQLARDLDAALQRLLGAPAQGAAEGRAPRCSDLSGGHLRSPGRGQGGSAP
ncbi:ribonuclease P protein component [Streptomyces gamaensis]|uniref:Ribonuclease P protein component n=1 Tax=Streptomyces gamaensis TaxID=1763542 RepID=A0ABW0YU88_9ACTN